MNVEHLAGAHRREALDCEVGDGLVGRDAAAAGQHGQVQERELGPAALREAASVDERLRVGQVVPRAAAAARRGGSRAEVALGRLRHLSLERHEAAHTRAQQRDQGSTALLHRRAGVAAGVGEAAQ